MAPATPDETADPDGIHERPVDLLRDLLRFDTSNPPGAERPCIEYVRDVLGAYGVDARTLARDPERPNLFARLAGGDAPALMLYGHVDVVPTSGQEWTHPPFEAVEADGFLWGRGALDMKGGVAMLVSAFLRAADEDLALPGDLVLCLVSDEEGGGDHGMGYLVEEHPGEFAGVEYAIGEFGGFPMSVAGERFYPVQVNEKQVCWLDVTFRGTGGHASLPAAGSGLSKLAEAVTALEGERLPVHVTPPVEAMLEAMAEALDGPRADAVRALADPDRAEAALDDLPGDAAMLSALLHNTANPTVARAGDKENVVPAEGRLTLDCRLLPGFEPADVVAELRPYVGPDAEFEVRRYDPGPRETDLGFFDTLSGVLGDAGADGTPVPFVLFASTDARHLARVDVQSYGFTPLNLPEGVPFMDLVHGADERVPPECIEFGADAVYEVVRRYGGEDATPGPS